MCVYSMVVDHYHDKWAPYVPYYPTVPAWPAVPNIPLPLPTITITPVTPQVTAAEIAEFRQLLDRARQYDKEHNEPDCDLQEKKDALKIIADRLGIDVSFV